MADDRTALVELLQKSGDLLVETQRHGRCSLAERPVEPGQVNVHHPGEPFSC